jgi:hypothetical protein
MILFDNFRRQAGKRAIDSRPIHYSCSLDKSMCADTSKKIIEVTTQADCDFGLLISEPGGTGESAIRTPKLKSEI